MLREIKFRAWSISGKRMRHWNDISRIGMNAFNDGRHLEFMQFTGTKDCDGVDIYEGDIVMILYTDWPSQSPDDLRTLEKYKDSLSHVGAVEYRNLCFCAVTKDAWDMDCELSMDCGAHGRVKVIGNIYENPELIGADNG